MTLQDYIILAEVLMKDGTDEQKKRIGQYVKLFKGEERVQKIKQFIDGEIRLGRVEV